MTNKTLTLLNEQKNIVFGLRRVCLGVIDLIENYFTTTSRYNSKTEHISQSLKSSIITKLSEKDGGIIPLFFKISTLLLKIIPLEQQLHGTHMIKNLEQAEKEEKLKLANKGYKITQDDLELLKRFIDSNPDITEENN